jgi:gamma-carbonic anhydrase
MLKSFGAAIRNLGRSIDSFGVGLQGNAAYVETLVPSARLVAVGSKMPTCAPTAFVAPSASVVGDVKIGANSSVWYNSGAKGDGASITIGSNSNIQDAAVVTANGKAVNIGNNVTVGPAATVMAGSTLKDGCMVGTNSVVEGSVIGEGAVVSANSVLTVGQSVPAGQVWAGNPAVYLRDITEEEKQSLIDGATELSMLASEHAVETSKSFEQIMAEKAAFKLLEEQSGDRVSNPSKNVFDERPGVIFHQEENASVTYSDVDQETIDRLTFNRVRGVRSNHLDDDSAERQNDLKQIVQ